jgi:hypothetical protein
LHVDAGPGDEVAVAVPELAPPIDECEYLLTISFTLKEPTSWARVEHEVAWDQFVLQPAKLALHYLPPVLQDRPLKVAETALKLTISAGATSFAFDKARGRLAQWTVDGRPMLAEPAQLGFWRAPTDNDAPVDAKHWRWFGVDTMLERMASFTVSQTETQITFRVQSRWAPAVTAWALQCQTTYTVYATGKLRVHVNSEPEGVPPDTLPRIGLDLLLVAGFNDVQWHGLEGESYPDSSEGSRVGLWSSTVDDLFFAYEKPQACGNRHETRWLMLEQKPGYFVSGRRLQCVMPSQMFDFTASHYTVAAIEAAKHPFELKKMEETILSLNAGVHGLGSGSCGPGVADKYKLKTQPMRFTIDLTASLF